MTAITQTVHTLSHRIGKRRQSRRKVVEWILLMCMSAGPASMIQAQPIQRRSDAPRPLTPSESRTRFRLPEDLQIELVASEPLIADPSAVAWDAHGRLFVSEIHGYNLEGHYDVMELNKTGRLDKVVRRIPAGPQAKQAAGKETYGTIKLLTDADGDGRFDSASTFADHLPPCHGIVPARDGIIVVCRPHILFLADRDGDGKAEVREPLFTGFGKTTLERSINNPRWGIDNWIYVAGGSAGGAITGPRLKQPVHIGATDFRFRADGTAIEPVTGRSATFGHTMNDWGDRFLIDTRSPALYPLPIPYRYLARNPFLSSPKTVYNAANYMRTYPASRPHPWRVERSRQPEWAKYYTDRYGAAEAIANGYFTSACGPLLYRADRLPSPYRGSLFACEPSQNLVHRCLLSRSGLRFQARRARGEEKSEFLTSTDQWFRPINLATGPDGAIYIVDMYREIIEDYSAIPRYLQQQYGLIEGRDRGRIWRIVPARTTRSSGTSGDAAFPADRNASELVALLSHTNAWWRHTAQRLLVEHDEVSSVRPALVRLAVGGASAASRLHALYVLAATDQLAPSILERALGDAHFAVRRHALRLCEQWLAQDTRLQQRVRDLVDDSDATVRLQLALTLGQWPDPRSLELLARLAKSDGTDEWFRAAILSSVAQSPHRFLQTVLEQRTSSHPMQSLCRGLASMIGTRHRNEEIAAVLCAAGRSSNGRGMAVPTAELLEGLLEGLRHGRQSPFHSGEGEEALSRLLGDARQDVRKLALELIGQLKVSSSPRVRALFAQAARDALNPSLSVSQREAAMRRLASAPWESLRTTAEALLDPRHPLNLQLAAVEALSAADQPAVADLLIAHWSTMTPQVRAEAMRVIFERTNRLPRLLSAMERKTVSPQSLGAYERVILLEHADESIRSRAAKLLISPLNSVTAVRLDRYRAALKSKRDVVRGKAVFQRVCSACHRLDGVGTAIGPDLTATQNRPDEAMLLDILQPSAKITAGYRSYAVVDHSGRIFTGVLASESATSVTLRWGAPQIGDRTEAVFEERTVLRKDIEQMKALDQSLMPEDLHKLIKPQEMADLLAYLRAALGPISSTRRVLFDEQPSFADQLTQGTGTASVVRAGAYHGKISLRITPPQRYSPHLPGWSFRIRKNPAPGEYRYLRLAWKTTGSGVMIELAADGNWPPAHSPTRRYYSGLNRTAWQATRVSSIAPRRWTVVTRDLWRDFGDFTLTGIAPTVVDGEALFDSIELLRSLDGPAASSLTDSE